MYLNFEKVKLEVQSKKARGWLWQSFVIEPGGMESHLTSTFSMKTKNHSHLEFCIVKQPSQTWILVLRKPDVIYYLPVASWSKYQSCQYRAKSESVLLLYCFSYSDYACNSSTEFWPKWKALNSSWVTSKYAKVVVKALALYSPLPYMEFTFLHCRSYIYIFL